MSTRNTAYKNAVLGSILYCRNKHVYVSNIFTRRAAVFARPLLRDTADLGLSQYGPTELQRLSEPQTGVGQWIGVKRRLLPECYVDKKGQGHVVPLICFPVSGHNGFDSQVGS